MALGRVFTVFLIHARFALTPKTTFFVSVGDRLASLTVALETTVVECADASNSIDLDRDRGRWPYRLLRPISLSNESSTLNGFEHITSMVTGYARTDALQGDGTAKQAVLERVISRHHLSIFERKNDPYPFTVRTRYASCITVVFEMDSVEWENKPQGEVDNFFQTAYNEFIDVYRAKATDVRPTYYLLSDQLVCATQNLAAYTAEEIEMEQRRRMVRSPTFDTRLLCVGTR